jgi:hypothetical protein
MKSRPLDTIKSINITGLLLASAYSEHQKHNRIKFIGNINLENWSS